MKKVLFASLFVAGTIVAANAQEAAQDSAATSTTTTTTVTSSVEQDGYVSIKADELPDAVKKSLETQDFKGWIINAASYNEKEGKYLVELKNGADTKKVKFDKEGKELKD
jgi:hypothetical protein